VPLFLEVDRDGRILWMNQKARARLGDAADLLEALGTGAAGRARGFLETCRPGDSLAGAFARAGRPPAPVLLACVLRTASRVILSAELRERAGDSLAAVHSPLSELQSRTLQNYFRLLRLQQSLDSRLRRRRSPGTVLIEQLERERARLARELHSGVGQSLSAITVHLELIEKRASELPQDVRGYLERTALLVSEAAREMRNVSHRLHPPDWQALSLAEALRSLWRSSGIPDKFQGSLTIAGLSAEPPHAVLVTLYRAAQEAVANVLRHSAATAITLALEERNRQLVLCIEDNGKGFDPAALVPGGIGLRSIREQAASLGGSLRITSGSGGTKLEVTVPLEPGDE
jgi:signal transduction histidine kinase